MIPSKVNSVFFINSPSDAKNDKTTSGNMPLQKQAIRQSFNEREGKQDHSRHSTDLRVWRDETINSTLFH